jgi:glutaminyl-tRNA synthetase
VHATLVPDTKSGTPGSDAIKVKGVITWVGAADALPAEVRLYDRLFAVPQPDTGDKDFSGRAEPRQPEDRDGVCGAVTGQRQAG